MPYARREHICYIYKYIHSVTAATVRCVTMRNDWMGIAARQSAITIGSDWIGSVQGTKTENQFLRLL